MLDHLRRIKSGGDLYSFKIDQIEKLEMDLRLLRTFVKYSHFLWPNSVVKITKKARRIVKMLCGDFFEIPDECKTNLDLKRLELQLLEVINGNTSISYNFELNGFDLSEYMDCLGENLNDVLERHRKSNRSIDEDEASGTGDIYSMRIKQINAEVTVMWSADVALKPHYVVEPSKHLLSQHRNPMSDGDEIVDFDIEIEKIIQHLARGTSDLDVIPTVGMGEQGKTTIARKVYKMKIFPPQGWYEKGIFSSFLSRNKIPSWFTKLVVRSILKENLFEDYYVQTASSESGVEEEEEEDGDDNILDYDDDDDDEEKEATLAEIEELFGYLSERNGTMLQQCVNIDELKQFVIFEG
ncbi:hypothetical protein T459_25406 [Capsicum annuum]|uniref:NB-ARC domain-containing protein n=1 Tax=Capsicum annuum TaxID=4072 RepID=A0A2G2YKM0_CAPAN|nr:hypothetical protein T459_25406 [Capsicum annuum]